MSHPGCLLLLSCLLSLTVTSLVEADDLVETWSRTEFVQVPGGVCPEGNWPSNSAACSGSVLYGCLPSWSGVIDFIDATPVNCTLERVVATATGAFGCSNSDYLVTATLNDETTVGEIAVDVGAHKCGCANGTESLVVADFAPTDVEAFHFGLQNLLRLSAPESFCACITTVVGTFTCDAAQDEQEKYLEQQTLERLYRLTNGDNWFNSAGWMEGTPCSHRWYGISCDRYGHVIGIDLSSNNLNGIMPDLRSAGSLAGVQVVNNQLFGSLPELPRSVTEIFFSENNFQGSIPDSWALLEQIEFFNLDQNFLTGSVPQRLLHGLVDVVQFSVANNFLNGTFPSDLSRNLRLLELTLSFNQFTGPLPSDYPSVDSGHLQYVAFDNNLFSGELDADYPSKAPLLTTLNVRQNNLFGSMPEDFASSPRLVRLDISDNDFSGALPDAYDNRPDILILASGNDWTCPLPDWCMRGVSRCGLCEEISDSFTSSSAPSQSSSPPSLTPSVGISAGSESTSAAGIPAPGDSSSEESSEPVIVVTAPDHGDSDVAEASTTTATVSPPLTWLTTDDIIVVVVATVVLGICGVSIVVGIFLFMARKRQSSGELELPSFVDQDE